MVHFNQQERLFLLSLCCILIVGSSLNALMKKYPHLGDMVNTLEDERFFPKVNINTADQETLVRIPYIGDYTAEKIIAYRKSRGAFKNLNELKNIKGIREKNFNRFAPYLRTK